MLVKPPIEELLPRVENRYTLALAVSKRVRQLVDGAEAFEEQENDSLITLACEELAHGDIYIVPAEVKPFIPQRPEVEVESDLPMDSEAGDEDVLREPMLPVDFSVPALTEAEEESHQARPVISMMSEEDVFLMPEEMDESMLSEEQISVYQSFHDEEDEDAEEEHRSSGRGGRREPEFDEEEIDQDLSDIEKISDAQLYKEDSDDLYDDQLDIDIYKD